MIKITLIVLLVSGTGRWMTSADSLDVVNKIALVTGGTRGIGFDVADELLKNGAKGVSLVAVNVNRGRVAARLLNERYGKGRAIFIPADVGNWLQLEAAFNASKGYWKRLDIVINNAGISNETNWKGVIDTNVYGTLQGTLLGFHYMSRNQGGRGGVIVNVASTLGIEPLFSVPVYSSTKSFIISLGRAMGHQVYYDHNAVRVVTVCPGPTQTQLVSDVEMLTNTLAPNTSAITSEFISQLAIQSTNHVAKTICAVIKNGSNGSIWVIDGDDNPPFEVELPGARAMKHPVQGSVP